MKRLYTLIELLTVIFVIAVLAGLIFPAISMVRGKAKRTHCVSNMKQVAALSMQFANDRDGMLPRYYYSYDIKKGLNPYRIRPKIIENALCNKKTFSSLTIIESTAKYGGSDIYIAKKGSTASEKGKQIWTLGLVRYAKYDMKVFFCPSDEERENLDVFDFSKRSSYSLNYGDEKRPGGKKEGNGVKLSQIRRSPANVMQFAEYKGAKDDKKADYGPRLGMDTKDNDTKDKFMNAFFNSKGLHKPHSNEYNMSFLDGRVESMRVNEISIAVSKDFHKTDKD